MKFKYLFLSLVAAIFLTSAMWEDKSLTKGSNAPVIEFNEGLIVGDDNKAEGKTKIVSFWSPKKPSSRIENRRLSKLYGESNTEYEFISICIDKDEALMREVMKIDGMDTKNNFSYSQISPRVFKDYRVEDSPAAFMISSDGKIIERI